MRDRIGEVEHRAPGVGGGDSGPDESVLQMQHGQLVPSLHAERLNPTLSSRRVRLR